MHRIVDPMHPDSIDLSVGEYDVALTTGTSYMTRRVEAAQSMMDAVQVFPQLMQVAGDLIAKAQDWPGADKIAERLAQAMQMQMSQVDPQEFQQLQQNLQKLQSENMMLKLEAKNREDELSIKRYDSETQRIRALSDNQVDGNQMEMDAIKMIIDGSAKLDEHDMQRENDHHARSMAVEDLKIKKSMPKTISTSGQGNSSQRKTANG